MLNTILTSISQGLLFRRLTILLFFATTLCCTSSKDFPEPYDGEQLHFGQGGGFTGIVTHYALIDDGRLFQKQYRDTAFTYLDTWDKDFVRQMFHNYHEMALDKLDHYHPGDLYYYIEHHSAGDPVHRISWGQTGYAPGEHVISFYNLLYRSTKARS